MKINVIRRTCYQVDYCLEEWIWNIAEHEKEYNIGMECVIEFSFYNEEDCLMRKDQGRKMNQEC